MSRCFPFPPPGYIRNGARNEALIESIKLQRDLEKAKQDEKREKKEKKKEKKREKKERKKEKKERKLKEGATSLGSDGKKLKHILGSDGKKLKHIDDLKETKEDGKLQKGEGLETEQQERSGITEEQEQPVSSREPCCLSDSTESSKRKRSASPSGHDHGIAIKVRLPLRKHKEPEQPKVDQVGTSNSLVQGTSASGHQIHVTNADANQSLGNSDSRHCKNLVNGDAPCLGNSDSRHCKNLVQGDAPVRNNRPHDEHKSMADLYNSLFQNPLSIEPLDSEDDDWLFRSDLTEAKPVKKVKSVTDVVQCSTPSLWPRAQYLPEVEIYALPYTVPY